MNVTFSMIARVFHCVHVQCWYVIIWYLVTNSIMDKFGSSFETMTDNYDPTTGVIAREKSKLKVI